MGLTVGDEDALGQHLGEHGVEFDGPFVAPELGPGEHRGAQINSGGIDDFDFRRLLRLLRQFSGEPLLQLIIGLFKDDIRALHIGVGQGRAPQRGKAQVIAFADLPIDTELQVPQIFAAAPLAEEHGT
jgi:hypothetical protein